MSKRRREIRLFWKRRSIEKNEINSLIASKRFNKKLEFIQNNFIQHQSSKSDGSVITDMKNRKSGYQKLSEHIKAFGGGDDQAGGEGGNEGSGDDLDRILAFSKINASTRMYVPKKMNLFNDAWISDNAVVYIMYGLPDEIDGIPLLKKDGTPKPFILEIPWQKWIYKTKGLEFLFINNDFIHNNNEYRNKKILTQSNDHN